MKYSLIYFIVAILSFSLGDPITIEIDNPSSLTKVTTKNVTAGRIEVKILNEPHHLFIGRCSQRNTILHQENIILTNDGRSHVSANIRMNLDLPVYISCVKVYDEIPNGEGGYPSFAAGGVGYNFVEFNVWTMYGKGFHFFVQIHGYSKTMESENGQWIGQRGSIDLPARSPDLTPLDGHLKPVILKTQPNSIGDFVNELLHNADLFQEMCS